MTETIKLFTTGPNGPTCQELQALKPHDKVQYARTFHPQVPFLFITTAGHGYLAVDKEADTFWVDAARKSATGYGYEGEHHIFLEEDVELARFMNIIQNI